MTAERSVCAALTCLTLAAGTAGSAHAFGSDSYLGTIGLIAGSYCPQGTIEADGRLLSIPENEALFAIYGTTYGGDGDQTFAVPDLRATVPVDGMRYCVMLYGRYPDHS